MVRRALALTAAVLAAAAPSAQSATSGGCGGATATTLGTVDATVLDHIHANEQNGTEVSADLAHVSGASDLLAALAHHDTRAVTAAVTRLVLHPHWHIVRLRVLDAHGRVVADVGGRYVIAPVGGTLRSGSRTLGSFLLSVQDDIGVAKLESRFAGIRSACTSGGGSSPRSARRSPPRSRPAWPSAATSSSRAPTGRSRPARSPRCCASRRRRGR